MYQRIWGFSCQFRYTKRVNILMSCLWPHIQVVDEGGREGCQDDIIPKMPVMCDPITSSSIACKGLQVSETMWKGSVVHRWTIEQYKQLFVVM